jgi:rhodanese-related sulfurtransferase
VAKTFMQMVEEAEAGLAGVTPEELRRRREENPNLLVVDVRDLADRRASGMIPGSLAISSGMLPVKADIEVPEDWRDARLQDRSLPMVTVCDLGPMSILAAKTLQDMGFADVAYLVGGVEAWKDRGLATEPPADT